MSRLFIFIVGAGFSVFSEGQLLDELSKRPPAPDYKNLKMWVAHPNKKDMADMVPGLNQLSENQDNAEVDVFFIYPTIYSKKKFERHPWFASVTNKELNEQIAKSTIKNQASVFNETTKVYSPFYRQAHLDVFRLKKDFKDSSLAIAYEDVKEAFEYYISNWNNNRPYIIASHSQGTVHAARLILEYIDGKALQERMVAAYLVGMPLNKDLFDKVIPCENASATGCWVSWNTYRKGYYPDEFKTTYGNSLSTNPLNWTISDVKAGRADNKGGVMRNFEKILPGVTDAQNHDGVLWVEKPHFPGRIFLLTKRYHIADFNLFYMNIRENVSQRINSFKDPTTKPKY